MSDFEVTFIVNIEADDHDDAVEMARQLIGHDTFEPASVEVSDEASA